MEANQVIITLQRIRHIIGETARVYESTNELQRENILRCLQNLHRIRSVISEETFTNLSNAINGLLSLPQNNLANSHYLPVRIRTGGRGRPAINITSNQLIFLFNEGYTMKKMAEIFSCSISVVSKKLYEEGIFMRSRYTNIAYEDLKEIITDLHIKHPNSGSQMMCGYLKSEGIFVQRNRIRSLLNDIDPVGAAKRWSSTIKRRTYSVPTPNSLWHMDAHCKLSRWGLIIHGCIDGYSRMIVYLSCATSIRAEPVLNLFVHASEEYGVPSRVRSDHGYENLFVAIFMNLLRGMHRGSHITGKSVHNQRIERLWVDVYKDVVDVIYNEIYALEDDNILDPENNIHRFCVQLIYLPIINAKLKSFMHAWNFHKIRTASRSPRQMWIEGMLKNCNSDHTAVTEIFTERESISTRIRQAFDLYGVDYNIINLDVAPAEELPFTATLNMDNEKKIELDNICNTNISPKEKYVLCVRCIS